MTCSITELLATGVVLEADEAVAIAQQLIAALRDVHPAAELQPPFGPPSADNVFLREDGTVFCRGCETTPAVCEIGFFLDSLLPEGSPRVPSGVRYTIARALLNIDVPPFGSLDELSRDLARHERGDRAESVRRALARSCSVSVSAAVPVDRRRHHASVIDLRRALHEADERLLERERHQHRELVIDMLAPQPRSVSRDRARLAAAACLAAGLVLVSASELMHREQVPSAAKQSAPTAAPVATPDEARSGLNSATPSPVHGIIAVHDTPAGRVRAARPDPRRIAVQHAGRSQAGTVGHQVGSRSSDGAQRRQPSRGMLDRLRLGWLRSVL